MIEHQYEETVSNSYYMTELLTICTFYPILICLKSYMHIQCAASFKYLVSP